MIRKFMLTGGLFLAFAATLSGCDYFSGQSYAKDINPILQKKCANCHMEGGEGTEKSGFLVSSYDAVMKGTKFGPVIIAGDATSSTLYRLVSGKVDKSIRMPHGEGGLSPEEIAVLQNWIDQGAKNN